MYGLSLCSWNANGIKRKFFEFKLFIEKHSPDIILLQETHLRPSQRFNICNYNCYRNDRITDGPASGGTLSLVKSTIPHFQPHSTPLQHIEASTVTLNPPNINPITITSLYIPPHSDKFLFTLDIENILQINSNCVIFGDFNATHNAWNSSHNSTRGTQLKNFADTLNLNIAFPNMPTRYGPHSSNTLDIALINNFNFPYEITSISDLSSDHNPVILNFSLCNITHILSKIAEHIILLRINQFIINTDFLNPNQYGFTKQLSTYHPLLRLTEQISAGFQSGRSSGAVFLDIQKAFHRVWISGLVYKLITNNFPAPLIHIINSYLVNRTYKVRVNNTFSLPHRVNIGVTQGSLLGPVLFNIYLNDILSHPQTMLNLYADDTAILATYKNHKTVTLALNKHLTLLENYFNQWKIKINVEKTIAVLFTKRIKPIKPPTLYSTPLQWSQSTKYLGLILDKNLTWKHPILHARDKFRHALRLIYPLICRNSEMDMYNKVLLYTAVLRPIISYGCPVWGYAAKTNIKILEVAQNSIIRTITKAHRYTRNSNIYKALKLHPFKNYIQILAKKFFANLHNINNTNLMNLENYTPQDDHKRPRRILLDSYNPP
ncbi:probable RNA-directed DNA polymerase from transposon BS [Trichonephila clavipes]|nr:probable RNA-directed DNA polymerase from transposon BS [Trichonephila clavipes]